MEKATSFKCEICGKIFRAFLSQKSGSKHIYCSRKCYGKSKEKKRVKVKCSFCNKLFFVLPSRLKHGVKYCSKICLLRAMSPKGAKRISELAKKKRQIKYCLTCNKKMELPIWNLNRKYCSNKCYYLSYINKSRPERQGSNHWNWQGGVTSLHRVIRKSLKMGRWRISVFKRDNYTCQLCGAFGGRRNPLNAHHLVRFYEILKKYKIKTLKQAENCRELWSVKIGLTVCKKCHDKINTKNWVNQSNL